MKTNPMKKSLIWAGLAIVITMAALLLWPGSTDRASDAERDANNERRSTGTEASNHRGSVSTEIFTSSTRANPSDRKPPTRQHEMGAAVFHDLSTQSAEIQDRIKDVDSDAEETSDGGSSEEVRAREKIRCTIHGRVTKTGQPEPNVEIFLHARHEVGEFKRAHSDAQGQFEFSDLRYGVWTVSARHEKHFAKGALVRCENPDDDLPMEIELQSPGVHVAGLVTDLDGNPLADAQLEVGAQNHPEDIKDYQVLPVPADGRYQLWLPAEPEHFVIVARAPGHQSRLKAVPEREDEIVLDFRLVRESVLRGEVLGPSGLASGVEVTALFERSDGTGYSASDRTDEQGRFAIETSEARVILSAWSATEGFAYQLLPPRTESEDVDWIVLQLQPGREIRGTIRLDDGRRVPLAELHFSCDEAAISSRLQADGQGDFVIPNLPPDLSVRVGPWADRRPFNERYTEVPPGKSTVEIVLHPLED